MAEPPIAWPVIGHPTVVNFLQRSVRRQAVSHAYLLYGPAQVGKATLAEHFAAALLCEQGARYGYACDECPSCRQRALGVHPDYSRVVPSAAAETAAGRLSISIDDVRQLQRRLSHRPVLAPRNVAMVVAADSMHQSAAAALLKTVEEPAGGTVVILTGETLAQFPSTLRSRCQRIRLTLVATDEITASLRQRGVAHASAEQLAVLSAGRPGRALSFFNHPDQRTEFEAEVTRFAALVSSSLIRRLRVAVDMHRQLTAAGNADVGGLLRRQLEIWRAVARDRMLAAAGCAYLGQWQTKVMPQTGAHGTVHQWRSFLTLLQEVISGLRQNTNPRLALEVLVLGLP